MTAFRGSLIKRADGATAVRAGRPSIGPLPAASARVLHVSEMRPIDIGQGPNWFATSCASRPLVLDPSNVVLGQLSLKREATSRTRLHVQLSPAAVAALDVLGGMRIPELGPEEEEKPAETAEIKIKELVFHETSFTRANLPGKIAQFLSGLKIWYASAQCSLTDAAQKIQLPGISDCVNFDDLAPRVCAYLEGQFEKQKGTTFSKSVYSCLASHIPDPARGFCY